MFDWVINTPLKYFIFVFTSLPFLPSIVVFPEYYCLEILEKLQKNIYFWCNGILGYLVIGSAKVALILLYLPKSSSYSQE